jgi:hypothetical protein
VSGAPGLLSWPAGWRLPGRLPGRLPRYDAPPRPQPVHAAPGLYPEEELALSGPVPPERSCRDGHEVVTWRGPDPCFACAPEPGQGP